MPIRISVVGTGIARAERVSLREIFRFVADLALIIQSPVFDRLQLQARVEKSIYLTTKPVPLIFSAVDPQMDGLCC